MRYLPLLLILISCRVGRPEHNPYSIPVKVMDVRPVKLGVLVTVRYRHMLFQHRYQTLPDSVRPGSTIQMPVFRRVK